MPTLTSTNTPSSTRRDTISNASPLHLPAVGAVSTESAREPERQKVDSDITIKHSDLHNASHFQAHSLTSGGINITGVPAEGKLTVMMPSGSEFPVPKDENKDFGIGETNELLIRHSDGVIYITPNPGNDKAFDIPTGAGKRDVLLSGRAGEMSWNIRPRAGLHAAVF